MIINQLILVREKENKQALKASKYVIGKYKDKMLILRQFLDLSLEENFFTGIDKVLVVGMVSKYTYFHHVLGTISIFYTIITTEYLLRYFDRQYLNHKSIDNI